MAESYLLRRLREAVSRGPGRRVLVCGGRRFGDAMLLGSWLGGVQKQRGISAIIEGGADGADKLARCFGEFAGIRVETYEADWRTFGPSAGPRRNQRMLDEGKPDLIVAFPGGSGTADMVRRAKAAGIEVVEVISLLEARTTPAREVARG